MSATERVTFILLFLMSVFVGPLAFADQVNIPLQLLSASGAIQMRCVSGGGNFALPVPSRWKVSHAVLHLDYLSSNNMIAELSQMSLRVNGELITQMRMNNTVPSVPVDIEIPAELLDQAYNAFSFQVVQHYSRTGCEQTCSPDLWTDINMSRSFIHLDFEQRPIPLRLGEAANFVFDAKVTPEAHTNLVFDTNTPQSVTFAGMVASGIARRFDYRKVTFTHSADLRSGQDNVLIGTGDFVRGVLQRYGVTLPTTDGGLIKIMAMPKGVGENDPLHALFLVIGETQTSLKIAAETFANMSLPYPGTDEMTAYQFSLPDISMYSGRETLLPEKKHELTNLGLSSTSFEGFSGRPGVKGFNGNGSELSFRLPPDFLIRQNQYAKLVLNFSYSSGLRQDSTLTLSVNGQQVRDIHLDSVSGNYIEGYNVDLPTYLFRPGPNSISFHTYLNTARQVCDVANTEGLFVSLYGNSTLTFPAMPHFVEMPKLELFALNGFPFTRWPDGYQTMIYLPRPDSASIDAAFNLIGLVTQKNGFPLFGTQIQFSEPLNWEGELLVIGEVAAIPASLLEHAPFQPAGTANVPYPISRGWDSEQSIAESRQRGGLGNSTGLVMEFESAVKRGRSVVLVTALDGKELVAMSDALTSPGIQANITGDVALIRLNVPQYEVNSLTVGPRYSVGERGNVSPLQAFLYANLPIFYGAVVITMLLLSLAGFLLLRRYRAKRLAKRQAKG